MLKIKYIAILVISFVFAVEVYSQNPANIDVKNLSDQQIQQIVNEVNARGLTMEQATQMAQLKGATPAQIEELKLRMQGLSPTYMKTEGIRTISSEPDENKYREKYSQKVKVEASPKTKRIYGYQLFNSDQLTFEPPVKFATPQNYVLGIGDELDISIWGASQQSYSLEIGTTGALVIPDVGPVYVTGMEFSKAKELIRKKLFSIYQGMSGTNPNTWCEISISRLRSIKVNVIGEALIPGTYTLPSTSSAFNALYLSGGPGENGSFRNIQVIRDNKIIKTLDVYDYLNNGNTSVNIQLREQDVLYIPVYKKRVVAEGSLKRSGFFELTENETVEDLLRYAGGFSEDAYQKQISVYRVSNNGWKLINLEASEYGKYLMQNGDSVAVGEIGTKVENRVTITGAVYRPGTYELTKGLTVRQLLTKAEGVKENYYPNKGVIVRLQENYQPKAITFNVDEILKGNDNVLLEREDKVIIQYLDSVMEKRTLQIDGEVLLPGEYEYIDNMSLSDQIFRSGGFTEAASNAFIELSRRHNYSEASDIKDQLVKVYTFNINRDLKPDAKADTFKLMPFDHIYVRRAPSYFEQRTVTVKGEVKFPGAYSISSKTERISDLLVRAGGLLPTAYVKGARLIRKDKMEKEKLHLISNIANDTLAQENVSDSISGLVELRLEEILQKSGTGYDLLLKDGDEILIPEFEQEVRLSGEIINPIGLTYESGRRLRFYVNKAGGFTSKADKGKIIVIASNGTAKITKSIIFRIYPPVEPGSQIVIPKKEVKVKTDNSAKWIGIASTLATISLTMISIINMSKN